MPFHVTITIVYHLAIHCATFIWHLIICDNTFIVVQYFVVPITITMVPYCSSNFSFLFGFIDLYRVWTFTVWRSDSTSSSFRYAIIFHFVWILRFLRSRGPWRYWIDYWFQLDYLVDSVHWIPLWLNIAWRANPITFLFCRRCTHLITFLLPPTLFLILVFGCTFVLPVFNLICSIAPCSYNLVCSLLLLLVFCT